MKFSIKAFEACLRGLAFHYQKGEDSDGLAPAKHPPTLYGKG
ncbi:hypothetical protein HMPREF0322_04440 [Desulfitobacterium hafniense DP7]|uniref:Uncharacterized protein n=1 Tax=Desulfitobacterium hafniense DP7 TaxID=537010 RepID=G9XTY2_DESHA|nr:hypothetical protein HMPREF0322_04440 [Desulfitobacterium hafniense DP7]